MSEANLPPMDSDEAYHALQAMIKSEAPGQQNDMTWNRVMQAFPVRFPYEKHIDMLVEAAGNQLLDQLTDTLRRLFIMNSKNVHRLVTGPYQSYAAAVAALPQRMVDLRSTLGVEFCEIVRQMIAERWAARDAVPPWHVINATREAELAR